jgi:hypothetical protein
MLATTVSKNHHTRFWSFFDAFTRRAARCMFHMICTKVSACIAHKSLSRAGESELEWHSVPNDVLKIMGPDEKVQLYIRQKIYHPKISIDSIIVTNERVILRHPHAMGLVKDYTDFSYLDVTNVILTKGLTRSSVNLVLKLGGDPLALDSIPNSEAQTAYGLIRQNLTLHQSPMAQGKINVAAQQPPPAGEGTTVIEREVVKIRCRYCGTLNDETSKTCSSCGAAL